MHIKCRGTVDRINKNHIVNNLVEAYLKEHPGMCVCVCVCVCVCMCYECMYACDVCPYFSVCVCVCVCVCVHMHVFVFACSRACMHTL